MLFSAFKTGRKTASSGLSAKMGHAGYYSQSIERLHRKWASRMSQKLHENEPEGFSFAQAYFEKHKLARLLARAVAAGEFNFSSAWLQDIMTDDKMRTVHAYRLIDRIVHGAVYAMLAEDIQKLTAPQVYSYVKGRNRQQAVSAFADYVREHRRQRPDPRTRGLFVLRCDIKSYGESIPVMPSSPLWTLLDESFTHAYGRAPDTQERLLLARLIHPVLVTAEGGSYQHLRGIPDGAPISAWLLNLYAGPLDSMLSKVQGGFYARYCDDIIFAHPDGEAFERVVAQIDPLLATLQLILNPRKSKRVFFNAAGRSANELKGTSHIEFLGLKIAFDGTLSLKTKKSRVFLRDLAIRARATAQATRHLPQDEQGRAVCRELNVAMNAYESASHAYAAMTGRLVNDRAYLRQLDYWIARKAISAVLRDDSVKAMRDISYRHVRHQWQLRSLTHDRNS